MSTDVNVEFVVKFMSGKVDYLLPKIIDCNCNNLEKKLKLLYTRKQATCICLMPSKRSRNLKTFMRSLENFKIRYRTYMLARISNQNLEERKLVSNKARFIKEQCEDKIDLRKKKKSVIDLPKSRNYDTTERRQRMQIFAKYAN